MHAIRKLTPFRFTNLFSEELKIRTIVIYSLAWIELLASIILIVYLSGDYSLIYFIPPLLCLVFHGFLSLLFIKKGKYNSAVRLMVFMLIPVYLFFISPQFSIIGSTTSVNILFWILATYNVFMIIFSVDKRILYFFVSLSVITLLINSIVNEKLSTIYFFDLNQSPVINPILSLLLIFGSGILFLKISKGPYEQLNKEHNFIKTRINNGFVSIENGVMLLKLERDEQNEISDMKILRVNSEFNKIFNHKKTNLKESSYIDSFPFLFHNAFNWQDIYFNSKKKKTTVFFDHLNKWFEIQNLNIHSDIILSQFIDISSYKNSIEFEIEKNNRLTKLVGAIPDIIFVIDKKGVYIDYVTNDPGLLELTKKDIVGKSIFEVGFSKNMATQIQKSIDKVITKDNIETIEYGTELPNGRSCIFEMRIAKLNSKRVISIGRDITTRKHYEEKLREAKKLEEKANHLKTAFLSSLSHEIRTPMNAIVGFSNILVNEEFNNQDKQNFTNIIISNANHLLQLINDTVSLSEIESKNVDINIQPFSLYQMVIDLHNQYLEQIKNIPDKNLTLILKKDLSIDFHLVSDKILLSNALSKLIDNAIKFSTEGNIEFEIVQSKTDVYFSVKDQGIGISPDEIAKIFDPFSQIDPSFTKKYSGTGIGLSIAAHYIQLLNGDIKVMSAPNRGSKFFFRIPIID